MYNINFDIGFTRLPEGSMTPRLWSSVFQNGRQQFGKYLDPWISPLGTLSHALSSALLHERNKLISISFGLLHLEYSIKIYTQTNTLTLKVYMQASFLFRPDSEYSGAGHIILGFHYSLLLPVVDIILLPSNITSSVSDEKYHVSLIFFPL